MRVQWLLPAGLRNLSSTFASGFLRGHVKVMPSCAWRGTHMHVEVEYGFGALAATIGLQQCDAGVEHLADGTGHALRRLHDGGGLLRRDVQQRGGVAFGGHEHIWPGVTLADVRGKAMVSVSSYTRAEGSPATKRQKSAWSGARYRQTSAWEAPGWRQRISQV